MRVSVPLVIVVVHIVIPLPHATQEVTHEPFVCNTYPLVPLFGGNVNTVPVPATAAVESVISPDVLPNIFIDPRVVVLTQRTS